MTPPRQRREQAEAQGRRGERLAGWFLMLKGWRIIARRVRVAGGEVDLIARRGRTLAFVEVKWRASVEGRDWALDPYRLRRVEAAAQALAPRYAGPKDIVRIDAILLAPRALPHHLTNISTGISTGRH